MGTVILSPDFGRRISRDTSDLIAAGLALPLEMRVHGGNSTNGNTVPIAGRTAGVRARLYRGTLMNDPQQIPASKASPHVRFTVPVTLL
ncbi:MAG TPA: hypothetical protein VJ453_08675 [Terriglobales bacterium]|nr:hypothetical protein [Terriglobales bacterium]